MCVRSNINRKTFVSYGKPHEGPAYNFDVMYDIVACMAGASDIMKTFALMDKGYTSKQILRFLEAEQRRQDLAELLTGYQPADVYQWEKIEAELNKLRV